MIRKIRLAFWPAEHLQAAVYLHHLLVIDDVGGDGWRALEQQVGEIVKHAWEDTREVADLLDRLERCGYAVAGRRRRDLCSACGIPSAEVRVDLSLVCEEEASIVMGLVERVRAIGVLDGSGRVGRRNAGLEELGHALHAWARGMGYGVPDGFRGSGQCSFGWADGERMTRSAREFLRMAKLRWPAGEAQIRRAFRRCAFDHHPDRNPDDASALERFILLQQGYGELMDMV